MAVRQAFWNAVQAVAVRSLLGIEYLETGVTYNPFLKRYQANLYPMYRRLQSKDPFHRSRLVGGWVLSRYEDVASVLRDDRFSADDRNHTQYEKFRKRLEKAGVINPERKDQPSILRLDPPDHTRLRTSVNKAFTPRAVKALRPRIEQIVHEYLDAVAANGRMDVIRDLAYPLPVIVIAEMLGIPTQDRERFKHWSDEMVRGIGFPSIEDLRRSALALRLPGLRGRLCS